MRSASKVLESLSVLHNAIRVGTGIFGRAVPAMAARKCLLRFQFHNSAMNAIDHILIFRDTRWNEQLRMVKFVPAVSQSIGTLNIYSDLKEYQSISGNPRTKFY